MASDNQKHLESLLYNELCRWFRDLSDQYMIDLERPGGDVIDLLANAISHQVNGRSANWCSPIEALLATALSRPNMDLILENPRHSLCLFGEIGATKGVIQSLVENQPVGVHVVPAESTKSNSKNLGKLDKYPSQRSIADQALDWLETGEIDEKHESQAILQGYAGMGKTYTSAVITAVAILERELFDPEDVILTAPSHQARKVIRRAFLGQGLDLETCTFAGLLGLTPKIDPKTGEEIYEPGENKPKIAGKRLVIGDEGSQWSRRHQSYLDREDLSDVQILWLGDDAQLPPVESQSEKNSDQLSLLDSQPESESPLFKLPGWKLTEIVRYSGAIAQLANHIRQNLDNPKLPLAEIEYYARQDESVELLSMSEWDSRMINAFKKSHAESADPDSVRVLAWRNNRVAEINHQVHAALYGEQAPPYVHGESILARKPCYLGERRGEQITLLQNGEQAVVLNATPAKVDGMSVWMLECLKDPDDNGLTNITLCVIDQSSSDDLKKKLQELANKAKEEKSLSIRSALWAVYYAFRDRFHDVALAHAVTVHKSQGSTFGKVFVDLADISQNRYNIRTRNRMIYTSSTRCSERSIFAAPR